MPSRTISSTFRGVRSTVALPCGNCGGSEFRSARPRDQLDQRECLRTEIIQGPHTDCSSNLLSGPCFAHAEHIWSLALRMYPIFWLALGCMRMLEVCQIPSGRAGFRQGEYGSRLPFHLQGAQGVTGICLVAEAIAVAGSCLPVHPAKIVESQEAPASIDTLTCCWSISDESSAKAPAPTVSSRLAARIASQGQAISV